MNVNNSYRKNTSLQAIKYNRRSFRCSKIEDKGNKILSNGIRNFRQQLLDLCIVHATSVRLLFANRNSDSINFI